jgi:hypothetical protein
MRHILLDAHAANWPGFAPLRWPVFEKAPGDVLPIVPKEI